MLKVLETISSLASLISRHPLAAFRVHSSIEISANELCLALLHLKQQVPEARPQCLLL